MVERRELLMDVELAKADEVSKLRFRVDEMHILKALTEMRGWKIVADYINKRLQIDRFLQTKTAQERSEVWGALTELTELASFLRKKITDGEEAAKALNKREEV